MKHGIAAAAIFASLAFSAGGTSPAVANSGQFYQIPDALVGQSKKNGETKPAEDLSGIACARPSGASRHCLLVDDDAQFAQFVTIKDNMIVAGDRVRLTDATFGEKRLEFDGEGVAFDCNAIYVIGSHGHPRDADNTEDRPEDKPEFAARIAAVSFVRRIEAPKDWPVDADCPALQPLVTPQPTALRALLIQDPKIRDFVDKRLEKNGLTIEGVAVRNGRLYAGLRGPISDDRKQAFVVAVNLDAIFGTAIANPRRFELKLGEGCGVRDLVRYGDGFLVLAGPSLDPNKHDPISPDDYAVFYWDGEKQLEKIGNIEGVKLDDGDWAKPEAIQPLQKHQGKLSVLVLFDGAPSDRAAREDTIDAP